MHKIDSSDAMTKALAAPIADNIKQLLALRAGQLSEFEDHDLGELAHWLIVERGDTITNIEAAAGVPLTSVGSSADPDHMPPWEWVLDHGDLYEAPIIMSDDGFGTVLIVPDVTGVDPTLLRLLKATAEHADFAPAGTQHAGSDR